MANLKVNDSKLYESAMFDWNIYEYGFKDHNFKKIGEIHLEEVKKYMEKDLYRNFLFNGRYFILIDKSIQVYRYDTMIIIDLARLRKPADFASDMEALSDAIKALPRVEGVEELRLPGERGARALKQARSHGIKIDAKVWDELVQVAQAYHVALPETGETK
jgi:hypothetical protein